MTGAFLMNVPIAALGIAILGSALGIADKNTVTPLLAGHLRTRTGAAT